MNSEQALTKIQKMIDRREFTDTRKYHICIYGGLIDCVPTSVKPRPWPIFLTVGEAELDKGLTNQQWEQIKRKIGVILELKGM